MVYIDIVWMKGWYIEGVLGLDGRLMSVECLDGGCLKRILAKCKGDV